MEIIFHLKILIYILILPFPIIQGNNNNFLYDINLNNIDFSNNKTDNDNDNDLEKLFRIDVILTTILNEVVNKSKDYKISDFQLHGVKITGFIDRIEKLQDGTFALYDYKTGKSKTSEITGFMTRVKC